MALIKGANFDDADLEIVIPVIYAKPAAKQGGTFRRFNADTVSRTDTEKTIVKVGAAIRIYDPVVAAILATEL